MIIKESIYLLFINYIFFNFGKIGDGVIFLHNTLCISPMNITTKDTLYMYIAVAAEFYSH